MHSYHHMPGYRLARIGPNSYTMTGVTLQMEHFSKWLGVCINSYPMFIGDSPNDENPPSFRIFYGDFTQTPRIAEEHFSKPSDEEDTYKNTFDSDMGVDDVTSDAKYAAAERFYVHMKPLPIRSRYAIKPSRLLQSQS